MKKTFILIKKHIGGINELILSLYSSFVFSSYSFIVNKSFINVLRGVIVCVFLSFLFCPVFLRYLSKLDSDKLFKNENENYGKKLRALFYLIPLAVFLFHYIAFYPGGYMPDTIDQFAQTVDNHYNDWHPVLQTLIALKLPLLLTGGWAGAPALFQLLLFSAVIGYSTNRIMDYSNKKYAVIALTFILINPQINCASVILWKDYTFAAFALLLTAFTMNIVYTKGEWIKKPVNTVLFVLLLTVLTLTRHNAILFTLPVLIAVLFYVTKKRGALIVLCTVLLVAGIKYPLYSAMKVEAPDSRQIETLGMPMTIIGAVASEGPDSLDDEIREFAFKIIPEKNWKKNYELGTYNSIKYNDKSDNEVIEKYGAKKIIPYMFRCFLKSPLICVKAFVKLTDPIYTLTDDYNALDYPYVANNEFNIFPKGIEALQLPVFLHIELSNIVLPYLTVYIGAMHMLLLVFALMKCKLNKKRSITRLLFVLPVFAYNFGTSLFLSSYLDSSRFFLYTFMITPVLMTIINKKET